MAIKKVYELAVDLKRTSVRVNIPVLVQGDSAEFRIRLLDNGAELSTEQLTGITSVKMQSGYDAQTVIQTVGALQGSVAVFRLKKNELFRSGTVQAMVQLEDTEDRISTLRFQYQVIPDLSGNYIPGEQDITVFQRYMNDAQAKIDEMAATDVAQLTVKLADKASKAELSAIATPLVATLVSGMTNTARIYVYKGSEANYTSGNWYYWNGTAWVSGGVYQSTAIADRSVGIKNTTFISEGSNLFNKNNPNNVPDKYYSSSGSLQALDVSNYSHKINVVPGDVVRVTYDALYKSGDGTNIFMGGFFNTADGWVGNIATIGVNFTLVDTKYYQFTVPANSAITHIRVNIKDTLLSTYVVVKNAVYPSTYLPYQTLLDASIMVDYNSLLNVPIPPAEASENAKYKSLITNVLAVGDSLTEGDYGNGAPLPRIKSQNYPYFLAKESDWAITNGGVSGYTATQWWDLKASTYTYTNFDTVILFLGTNKGLSDTLVADTTITTGQTYLDYANTHTGNYCKIIEKIKAENPKCKIFLSHVFVSDVTAWNITNSVITQISQKYGLPLLNIDRNKYYNGTAGSLFHPYDAIHFGKVGYHELANDYFKRITAYIAANLPLFNS